MLSTGRVLEHWHTGAMTRRSAVLDELEPEAMAFLSPRDVERLGVERGDMIRVSTRRGAIEHQGARRFATCRNGMVFIPFCYAEAAANLLTNPALDPFGKIPEFKFCAAQVEPRTTAEWQRSSRRCHGQEMAQLSDDCFAFGGSLLGIDAARGPDLRARDAGRRHRDACRCAQALGRTLAEDIAAPIDVPGYDNSAVDGYAVRFDDLDPAKPTTLALRRPHRRRPRSGRRADARHRRPASSPARSCPRAPTS